MSKFKLGEIVWNKREKRKGKIIATSTKQEYKAEVITAFDKETSTRTTTLTTWHEKDLDVYRKPKKKHKKPQTTIYTGSIDWAVDTKPLKIKVKYFDNEIDKLEKISKGDWIDLRASETVELKQFESALIPLGVGMKLPDGYEANVLPRSSTFAKWGVIQTNSEGVIDNSYSGNDDQWKMPVLAMRDTIINKNDRICQFRIVKSMPRVEIETVDKLDETSRGGFGSTGTN